MTCVLSMPTLFTNPFSEGGADIQNNGCESLDYNWITPHHPHSGLSDFQRCPTPCHVEASTGSSISCRMEISDGQTGRVKHENFNMRGEEDHETHLKEIDTENQVPTNGTQCVTDVFEIGNKTDVGPGGMHINNHGVKRKAEVTESGEIYIPSKRVSPFLNTPKERKDERKKILKISIKKLKQLDDPEAFLRRTVLVNNFTKRLQSELRQEKRRTKKRKSFSGYGVNNNNCMSDIYLFDDPFLSGVHEKITDDMTDTLINNVLHETNDRTNESDNGEKTDLKSNEMDVPDEQLCVDSRTFTALNSIKCNSDQSSSDESTAVIHSRKESSLSNCLDNNRGRQEKCVVGCDELEVVRGSMNTIVESFKTVCQEISETINPCERDTKFIENKGFPSTEQQNVHSDLNMECDKLHLETPVKLKKSLNFTINCTDTVQNYTCTDKYNSYLASKVVVTEHKCSSDQLELDQKLDQKSLLHSFNTFLSYTES